MQQPDCRSRFVRLLPGVMVPNVLNVRDGLLWFILQKKWMSDWHFIAWNSSSAKKITKKILQSYFYQKSFEAPRLTRPPQNLLAKVRVVCWKWPYLWDSLLSAIVRSVDIFSVEGLFRLALCFSWSTSSSQHKGCFRKDVTLTTIYCCNICKIGGKSKLLTKTSTAFSFS